MVRPCGSRERDTAHGASGAHPGHPTWYAGTRARVESRRRVRTNEEDTERAVETRKAGIPDKDLGHLSLGRCALSGLGNNLLAGLPLPGRRGRRHLREPLPATPAKAFS
jgi:hypothetical protein